MHLTYRNVNSAFAGLVRDIHQDNIPTIRKPSRNGNVIRIPEPLIVTYTHPRERVLFNQARDCNPFFHLYESLWMLAGRNDVAPLVYYNSKMVEFSDDGKTFNGAYGCRWRHANPKSEEVETGIGMLPEYSETDQLKTIMKHLKQNPQSRRAVLNMWNVEDDLLKIDMSKDVCCNLNVMFSIRTYHPANDGTPLSADYLDMTVTNRSNDLILGMLGANVVHFSMLQEYVAACVGVEVGVYNQFTNNGHVYEWNWEPEKWLNEWQQSPSEYEKAPRMVPLVKDPATFDRECAEFVTENADGETVNQHIKWEEPFLNDVAQPMCHAFHNHKWRDYEAAFEWVKRIKADDWRIAAAGWINRREANWSKRQAGRGESLQVGD